MNRKEWIVDQSLRIDEFVYQKGITKKALKDIKMKGDILVDGVHQTVRYILNIGEVLTLIYPLEDNHIEPQNIPLHIVYEDDYLLVIDKPKGMPCIPTRKHPTHTLSHALTYYYQTIGLTSTIHLVNRLDMETSGLMIVAKYRDIHHMMCQNMKHIYRKYRATVKGYVESGIIDLPIYREGIDIKRVIDARGKPSITHYQLVKKKDDTSIVEFVLKTGRTHQIRVHMSYIGHPLIGDVLYGDGQGEFDLTSVMVAFVHPITQKFKVIQKKD